MTKRAILNAWPEITTFLVFGLYLYLAFIGILPTPAFVQHLQASSSDTAIPQPVTREGRELVLIYIGSSTCGASTQREMPDLLRSIREKVGNAALQYHLGFATIGISKDNRVTNGLAHLAKFEPFDEVMTGRGWLNTGVVKYMFGEMRGDAATPTILVIERHVRFRSVSEISDEHLLVRKTGLLEIKTWLANGAALPHPTTAMTH